MSRNPTLVDIEEFSNNANSYYERAKNGEQILVTVEGEIKYQVFTDITQATSVLNEIPQPTLTTKNYAKLLDMLDPLD